MYRLRLLICGEKGMGQTNYIGPAIVNKLENWGFFVKSFDLNTLLKESYQVNLNFHSFSFLLLLLLFYFLIY